MSMEKMPNMPNIEQVKSPERILIEMLREKGLTDETRKYLIEYQEEQERLVEQLDRHEEGKIGQFKLNARMARIYDEAGLKDLAIESYEHVLWEIFHHFKDKNKGEMPEFYWEIDDALKDLQ